MNPTQYDIRIKQRAAYEADQGRGLIKDTEVDKSPITVSLARLNESLDELHNSISKLGIRLASVLAPIEPESDVERPPYPNSLNGNLCVLCDSVYTANQKLQVLISNLEL